MKESLNDIPEYSKFNETYVSWNAEMLSYLYNLFGFDISIIENEIWKFNLGYLLYS